MSWKVWAALAWLAGWAVDCGHFTFHECECCRDNPEPSWGQYLFVYLWSLACWWLNLAVLVYIGFKNRGNKT